MKKIIACPRTYGIEHKLYVFEGMVHDFIAFPIPQAKPAQELVIRLLKR